MTPYPADRHTKMWEKKKPKDYGMQLDMGDAYAEFLVLNQFPQACFEKELARLLKRTKPDVNGCLIWQGTKTGSGYGGFSFLGHIWPAHRVSFLLTHGWIPKKGKHVIMHICDVPLCVNPRHLQCGSYADNVHDMVAKKRNRY